MREDAPAPPLPVPPDPTIPMPDPALPVTINIIGTFGAQAFDPNPGVAAMADMLVWTNSDTRLHHIMLDDGTDVGEILPGTSTVAMPLTAPTMGYHCTIHPSMVGVISSEVMPMPPPQEPPPDYEPPPYYYGRVRR